MRVAIVNQAGGGGASVAASALRQLSETHGFEIAVFPEAEFDGEARSVASILAFRPDLLHLHCWYNSYSYGLLESLSRSLPTVFTVHDPFVVNQFGVECWECFRNPFCLGCPGLSFRRRWYPNYRVRSRFRKRIVNKRARCHVVYPSEWMKQRLSRSEWSRLPSSVIPYGVEIPPAGSVNPPSGHRVLFAGNMYSEADDRKGLRVLLEAFRIFVRKRIPEASLTIAGRVFGVSGDLVGAGVEVAGEASPDRMAALYAGAKVVAVPSLGDNLPLVVLEAMARGRPVVASRVGGIPEELDDGRSGRLVPPGDPGALGEALVSVLADDDLARRLGAAGRARAESRFTVEGHLARTAELYQAILARGVGR
jgi:glycosyltransferase involved in cell wall biosynthesis